MYCCSTMMKPCCMVLTLLVFFCQCSKGFVVVSTGQPRAAIMHRGSSRMMRALTEAGAPTPLSLPTRRRRRIRGRERQGRAAGGGAGSLRAGMNMPSLELVAGFMDGPFGDLLEQSARHHYPSAFIGGTVGVLGTLTAIQIKINQVRELTACPYCRSSGQLPCATCFGAGSVTIQDTIASSNKVTTTTLTCPCCRGKTFITCVNCRGDGRGVPLFLNKKVSRDPESEIEDVGYA